MIFCSKNEQGIPAWKLILEEKKDVTRRTKPLPVGAVRSVQPGRGKKAVCKFQVLSCCPELDWQDAHVTPAELEREARREGFGTWLGLRQWLAAHNPEGKMLFRIEFKPLFPDAPVLPGASSS